MPKKSAIALNGKMPPIDRSGITELVVERIKNLLEQGDLKAGSRLPPERELADMLDISRPSLRTALKALSVMGIIRAKPGAGTYIADSLPEVFTEPMRFMTLINHTSDEELFEARLIIEAGLAELAATRATATDLKNLAHEINAMRAAVGDEEKFLRHDVRFHRAIAHAAGNKIMTGVMDTIAELLFHMRRQTIAGARDFQSTLDWHLKIYAAIKQHDAPRAKEAITGHLREALAGWQQQRGGQHQK
ncbi:MAG: FadR family transcriptional regulator [Acidobacteria bacterium]|nr:FadR family transcriptional regulator [Acidobacteriota bacterium]